MVFESLVADLLNKFLGNYVVNLDSKQLSIGIWGGDVMLTNLQFRENALDDLDLPVNIVHGYLGKLVLKIPWKNLYTQRVVAQIEDFYVVITPKLLIKYDAEKEEKLELQTKQATLQALDIAFIKDQNKDAEKENPSFTEKLSAQIVNNLQVKIANVHIRYEDTTTTGSPFSFGVTLKELEFYTTDMNWEKCFLTEQVSRVFKIANLDSLAVYMNCQGKLYSILDDISSALRDNIADKENVPPFYTYVFGPISSYAKLALHRNPESDDPPFQIPKVDLNLEMATLNIGLTSTQFQDIIKLAESMNRMKLGVRYRKYRPFNTPYKGHYREWWQFAITAILEEDIRKKNRDWSWRHILEHRGLCRTYFEKYKEKELTKKPPANLTETCTLIEKKLDIFNLVLIRKRLQIELAKIREREQRKAAERSSWFGWFGGGKSGNEQKEDNIVEKFEAAMTKEEKEKLYEAIGYDESTVPVDLPESYEALKMSFKLVALRIGLYDDTKQQKKGARESINVFLLQPIMLLNFSMTQCSVRQRPGANALSVTACMKEMQLTGLEASSSDPPTLIQSEVTDEFNLLDIFFETNPLDKTCDQRIIVLARPLRIIYDSPTILHVFKLFAPPKSLNLSEIEVAASERMANFKERSATGMQYIIETRCVIEVDIQFMPTIMIIPSAGIYKTESSSLIIVSLGELTIVSNPHKKLSTDVNTLFESGTAQEQILQNVMDKAYDIYRISLDDIQILVSKPKEDWESILNYTSISEMHVLNPTSLMLTVELCAVDDDPRLPKTKAGIVLPSIHVNLTEDRIYEALGVVTSIPLPESDTPEPLPLVKAVSSATSIVSIVNFLQDSKKKKKSSTKSEELAISEVIQYTDLEVKFALTEICVTLYKTSCLTGEKCFAEESNSPVDSEKFGTPVEEIQSAEIIAERPPGAQKILSLQILQLEADLAQRTYEMVATARLGAINLMQYDQQNETEEVLSVIDTPQYSKDQNFLLTVSYTQANKASPEFITKYNSTEQLAVINFSILQITAHQEYLLCLMALANTFQNKMAAMSSKPTAAVDREATAADVSILDRLSTIWEDTDAEGAAAKSPPPRKPSGKVVESIKMHVVANLEQVALLIACKKRSLASISVKHFNAGAVMKSSYTEVTLRLKDIVVTDPNPLNIHSGILSIVGKDALNTQVVLYNLDETADYNSDDMKIVVDIGCVKIVFLNWFVTSVLSFLNNFQAAQEAVANASAAAADAARQNAIQAYEKATRMKLDIKIKAPIIVVPVDSQSLNAIVLDLGSLKLSNVMSIVAVPNEERSPAVIDEIQLELKDLKLSKCVIMGRSSSLHVRHQSRDTVDLLYGLKSNINILNPMSFTLNVKRNLSNSWYFGAPEMDLSGQVKSIQLNLFMEDYALIISILNRNLTEGADEFPRVVQAPKPVDAAELQAATEVKRKWELKMRKNQTDRPDSPKLSPLRQKKVYEQLKFNFQFDGVIANLYQGFNEGLARFGLYFLSMKGTRMVSGTITTSIVLCNIQIEDTRPDSKSAIRKYLCRKEWKIADSAKGSPPTEMVEACRKEAVYMVDITAIIKPNDMFTEVRVYGFDLIICIDFLMEIAAFFKLPEEESEEEEEAAAGSLKPAEVKAPGQKPSAAKQVVNPEPSTKKIENKFNLILIIEEPDIILVESLEDINTNAIIFNTKAYLNYRGTGEKQLINGQIDSLKMYMSSFMPERRESTKHYIIHPCAISLQGSTPQEEGLHINLKMSEIVINVSPATIELINKALLSVTGSSSGTDVSPKKESNYSALWTAKTFKDNDYWFIRVDEADDVLETIDILENQQPVDKHKTERCIVEVPSIMLVVESGVGYYTTPLISIDTKINATIRDWSSQMNITGSLCLSMNYYNHSHAVWEPIIELIERTNKNGLKVHVPWELSFGLWIETKKSEFDETIDEQTTRIKIKSEDVLELTVSKTCLELVGALSEAFSQAIDAKGLVKPDVIAPYVVENDTGFDISINFRRGIFTLHECHMPTSASTPTALNRALVFKVKDTGKKIDLDQVKDCKISPGGRAYLQTKNLSLISLEEDEQYNLYVTVGSIKKEIELSVSKSNTRYYPLYRDTNQEPWGILSEVRSEYGTTKINIHGAVNVHNHFTADVTIYRQKPQSNEKIAIGVVPPGQVYHVPLHAIYAESKEFYFSLSGYKVSVQGIKWNDCPTDLSYCRQVQCDPVDTFEPFYMNAVRTKTEVFYENTAKYKLLSAFYTIHLRAPVYLRNALPISITVSVAGCSVRQRDEVNASKVDMSKTVVKEELLDYGEKQIDPGDVLLLPTVKMSGKSKEGRSYLVIRLIQYLEKDWSCTTEISAEQKDLELWTFTSYDSTVQMNIELCVRFEHTDGSLMANLFSPFWMINKTGLMLSYRTDNETVDVLYHPPEYNGPILFSFTEKFFFDKKRAAIRVGSGEWSSKIPLDVAGSTGAVTCKVDDITYEIGVHNHLTQNSLTKQITFIPFYIATNKCSFRIDLQEKSRPGDDWMKIEPNACQPLWPLNDSDHMIVARVDGQRSVAFNYSEMQCTLLQLQNNKYGGINVDVQTTEGGVYITFTQYNRGDAPGQLINHTSKPIVYFEKGSKIENVLRPRQRILYTWIDPAGEKILIFGQNKARSDLRRDGIGPLITSDGGKAYWVSFLDGLQRVLLFTEVEAIATKSESSSALQSLTQSIEIGIHGIGLSVVNNETGVDILYLGIISSGIIWEQKKEHKNRYKSMNIHDTQAVEAQYEQYLLDRSVNSTDKIYSLDNKWPLDFEAMTLTKASATRRILRTFYPGIWISQKSSPFQTQLHVKINKIQIDNQLNDCIFPVVLAAIPPPKSVATTTSLKPFIECSMVERVVPNSTVKQFKYASILMQEFHFKVDILFLSAISNLFSSAANEEQAAKLFAEDVLYIEKPLSDLVQTQSMQEQKNFYDNLHLGPLKIHVSFSMAGSDTTALPGFLSTLVQGVGVTLTDVNDVVFRLAFFEREYQFFTQQQLLSEITTHYTGQGLKQMYVLVLGLDVLGNPYGLVVGLKKGVEDLFYEPFQGAIQGPGEFAEGLVLGVKSLFGHTVGGAAGAVSKITGAVGKGIAALTFDDDYQRKRRENLNKRPTNFHEGIARSGKGLVMGFVDGVTGVVCKPVAGAREEGVEGFFKGLGKGAIGLVARPTAGVVDFASGSFEAVKRAAEGHAEAQRLRPPRFLHQDMVLRPYSMDAAQGNKLLREIDKGKYASTDSFVHCEEVVVKHEYVVLTNHRIIYAHKSDIFGTFTVQWAHLWDEIDVIISTDRGVEFKLKKEAKKIMGLFSSHESQRKVILLPQESRRSYLMSIIDSERKAT